MAFTILWLELVCKISYVRRRVQIETTVLGKLPRSSPRCGGQVFFGQVSVSRFSPWSITAWLITAGRRMSASGLACALFPLFPFVNTLLLPFYQRR